MFETARVEGSTARLADGRTVRAAVNPSRSTPTALREDALPASNDR
jgi:hypothetical protein